MNANLPKETVHRLCLEGRRLLELTGITDVEKFGEGCAVFQTGDGQLTVDGEELHILRLEVEKGEVALEGRIFGLFYADGYSKKGGLLRGKKGS